MYLASSRKLFTSIALGYTAGWKLFYALGKKAAYGILVIMELWGKQINLYTSSQIHGRLSIRRNTQEAEGAPLERE